MNTMQKTSSFMSANEARRRRPLDAWTSLRTHSSRRGFLLRAQTAPFGPYEKLHGTQLWSNISHRPKHFSDGRQKSKMPQKKTTLEHPWGSRVVFCFFPTNFRAGSKKKSEDYVTQLTKCLMPNRLSFHLRIPARGRERDRVFRSFFGISRPPGFVLAGRTRSGIPGPV